MNKIENIIKALESLDGSATLEELTKTLCKSKHIIFDNHYKSIVKQVLNNNKSSVSYSDLTKKWSLKSLGLNENEYLYVSENRYFKTIREAMYELFGMKVSPRSACFKIIGTNDYAWFPKFDGANHKWTNTLSDDGRIWREKTNTIDATQVENNRHLEEDRRYVFAFEKVGNQRKYRFTGVFKQARIEEDGTRVYEIVDDKLLLKSSHPYMMICNISYMKEYKGITDDDKILGGGRYPTENGDGGEKENFLSHDDGFTYGFVETNYIDSDKNLGDPSFAKQIHLEKLNPSFKENDEIEGVRVVFISKGPNNDKNVVVGWYNNAKIFRNRHSQNEMFSYNIMCANDDAHLISEGNRTFKYPKKNDDGTYNFGQQNVSYPYASGQESTIRLANELNDYLNSLLERSRFFYEPINLNKWDLFKEVEGVGHEVYFKATKSMKKGDYILCHVGTQVAKYEAGIYAIAKILTNPQILTNCEGDYCNNQLSVNTEIIKFSTTPFMTHNEYSKYDNMFRGRHKLDDKCIDDFIKKFELDH